MTITVMTCQEHDHLAQETEAEPAVSGRVDLQQ